MINKQMSKTKMNYWSGRELLFGYVNIKLIDYILPTIIYFLRRIIYNKENRGKEKRSSC